MRKLTIFEWFGIVMPMEDKYKAIKRAGFDGVMIWWGEDDVQKDDYKRHPRLAEKCGLYIENVHTPFERANDIWLDNLNGETYVNNLIKYASELPGYGIKTMVVHLTGGENPPPMGDIGFDRIKRLLDAADRNNIYVAVENLKRADYTAAVFGRFTNPSLKFCYDSGHNACTDAVVDYLSLYGNKLAALHLHDNDGKDDLHRAPFDGVADWQTIAGKLKATGYAAPSPSKFIAAPKKRRTILRTKS